MYNVNLLCSRFLVCSINHCANNGTSWSFTALNCNPQCKIFTSLRHRQLSKNQLHTFGLAQENTHKLLILQLQQQQTNYISYTDSLCWIVSYTPKKYRLQTIIFKDVILLKIRANERSFITMFESSPTD